MNTALASNCTLLGALPTSISVLASLKIKSPLVGFTVISESKRIVHPENVF
ncbi:MAG: hypothetical protein WCH65_08915 [bacterium]